MAKKKRTTAKVKNSVDAICHAVWDFDLDEMHQLNEVVRSRFNELRERASLEFKPRDEVHFMGRRGELICGKVVRRLKKNVLIQVWDMDANEPTSVKWRVGPTLIQHGWPATSV